MSDDLHKALEAFAARVHKHGGKPTLVELQTPDWVELNQKLHKNSLAQKMGLYDGSDDKGPYYLVEERFPPHTITFHILPLIRKLWAWMRRQPR